MSESSPPNRFTKTRVCAFWLGLILTASCGVPAPPIEQPTPMPGASPFAYPVELWDLRLQGETLLMVHVTELGAVDSAYVLDSSGYQQFDSAAVRGAHQLRFSPGRQGPKRVAVWTKLPVRFSLDTVGVAGLPASDNGAND